MSNWSDLESAANAAMIATFGVSAIFTPQDGFGGWLKSQTVAGVLMRPALLEELPPGLGPGTIHLRFWVDLKGISPPPQRADRITFEGTAYLVHEIEADIGGGAVLYLRQA